MAKQSMLNYPKCTVYAMDKKLVKDIPKEAIVEPNIVSLVQSLKDVEDERVEMQIG